MVLRVILLLCVWITSACSSHKTTESVQLNDVRDTRVKYREKVVIDTVIVEVAIPAHSAANKTTDTVSILETDYAISKAWTDSDGLLNHALYNKASKIPVPVFVPSVHSERDSVTNHDRDVPVPYPVYVERDLTRWERFRLNAFWVLAAVAVVSVGWKLKKLL